MSGTTSGTSPPARPTAHGLSGDSQPLEPGIRDLLSTAFGHDFSPVRVHAGARAASAARDLGAAAYTVGNDIVFAEGAYDPLSRRGRGLIAHELAHVVQHGGRAYAPNFLSTNPTATVPAADRRLERQAHLAADLSAGGVALPRGWSWERAHRPFVGKTETGSTAWTELPEGYEVSLGEMGGTRRVTREQWSSENPAVARVNLGAFPVPENKGPWGAEYDRIARAGGLQATVDVSSGRIRAGLWQKRAPSPELRNLWLLRVGWPRDNAAQWWEDAGGSHSPSGDFSPKTAAGDVQIDHVVELQLGGTNVPENLAPHTGRDNEASGREIWTMMRTAAQSTVDHIKNRPGGRNLSSLSLYFESAQQLGNYSAPALTTLPASDAPNRESVLTSRRGTAQKALSVHFTAIADKQAGTRPSAAEQAAANARIAALTEYIVKAGPSSATLRVPAAPSTTARPDLIENSEVPQNHANRELISGLVLASLVRPASAQGVHTVKAYLNSPNHPVRSESRLPLLLRSGAEEVGLKVDQATRALRLVQENKRIEFTYPYLSSGSMNLTTDAEGNLAAHGTITPSIPLLSRVPITVDWDRRGLRGSISAPSVADRLSLPPFRVTEAALTVDITPELRAGGHIAFVLGTMARGRIEAGADPQGFFARGTVTATIPGLDSADGQVEYRPAAGLAGFVVVRASRPSGLIRSGEVRLELTRAGWGISGQVNAMLPGDSPAQLSVRKQGDRAIYTGRATINVPALRPVEVEVSYDGEHVSGSARTTFSLLGANGELQLRYRDGRFSGNGAVQLQRGRFSGRLEAAMDEHGRLSGRGTGSLEIRPGLVGTIGIEYGTDRRLKTTGELRFPPYTFLQPRGSRYELFHTPTIEIPIFAIPLGVANIGVVGTIGGGLAARYQFGPGQIRDMVIRATLYPLEDDMQAELAASATLVLPAEAGIELSIRAGLGLGAGLATVSGGIAVIGGVLLRGGLNAHAELKYARDLLTFDARAEIRVEPVLTLRIEADVAIELKVGGSWRWPYELAAYSYGSGLQFGMVAPFHYQSDQPLQLPSVSDIQWIVPDINVSDLIAQIGSRVRRAITA